MKKKLLSIILLLGLTVSLFSCGADYPPVESTEEEKRTVMTLGIEDKVYEIPYELYRAFFLNLKSTVDGGNASAWSGKDKDKYVEQIDKLIIEQISDVYAVFHIASRIGIDLYSEENEQILDNYVKASVEGGIVDSMEVIGFDGDYDAYLASLKELNLNYSAQRTMLRYALGSELIDYYYIGDETTPGELKYTEDDVREFYFGDESARVIEGYFKEGVTAKTKEELVAIRDAVAASPDELTAALIIIRNSITGGEDDIINGSLIGKYSRDPIYYSELTEAALSLSVGECAELIEVSTGYSNGYYIIYKAEKSEENFKANLDYVTDVYLAHRIGKLIYEAKSALIDSARATDALKALDRASIKMN